MPEILHPQVARYDDFGEVLPIGGIALTDPRMLTWTRDQCRLLLSRYRRDESSLLVFMFHALVEGSRVSPTCPISPSNCNTVADLDHLVEFYLDIGYKFVGPTEVLAGLDAARNHVLLTFDDGYFNNVLALPILTKYQIPALFFISTGHVNEGRAFWPNVVYRERTAKKRSAKEISREISDLKTLQLPDLAFRLRGEFGDDAMTPLGDADRPFHAAELAEFARHPMVHIGNHTRDHAILAKLDLAQVHRQIASAQEDLERICGIRPISIAYPNGDWSKPVVRAAAAEGISLGFTVEKRKTPLPLSNDRLDLLTLSRLHVRNDRNLRTQLEIYRGPFGQRSIRLRDRRAA